MARSKFGFCSTHRIGYNREFDAICPQCVLQRMPPAKQYDYDAANKTPIDTAGKPVDLDSIEG